MKKYKLALLGGDRRQAALAVWLDGHGIEPVCCGLPSELLPPGVCLSESYTEAVERCDAVVLPLPVSGDSRTLSCPLDAAGAPKLEDIFAVAGKKPVLGGRFAPAVKQNAESYGVRLIDYFDCEELKIRNSVLASEGAVSIAMNRLEVSISCSRSAVTGYGRLGKTLAPMLKALGSNVTVAARKSVDLAWAAAYGFETLRIGMLSDGSPTLAALTSGYDVIFNTVPYWLFDDRLLGVFSKDTLIIDLASAPGGVDPKAAKQHGINVVTALSLPGKYAPVSAGYLIGEYISGIIRKELL